MFGLFFQVLHLFIDDLLLPVGYFNGRFQALDFLFHFALTLVLDFLLYFLYAIFVFIFEPIQLDLVLVEKTIRLSSGIFLGAVFQYARGIFRILLAPHDLLHQFPQNRIALGIHFTLGVRYFGALHGFGFGLAGAQIASQATNFEIALRRLISEQCQFLQDELLFQVEVFLFGRPQLIGQLLKIVASITD